MRAAPAGIEAMDSPLPSGVIARMVWDTPLALTLPRGPTGRVECVEQVLRSEQAVIITHADAVCMGIVPVFRVVLDDGGPWVDEIVLDTVEGFETAVLEEDVLQQGV